jgi:hypothetical protein
MICADVAWTFCFIKVSEKKPFGAGMWSSALVLFNAIITVAYVNDHRLLIAAALGSFIGTYGTIAYKNGTDCRRIQK